jgi:hypothetical protein
MTDPYVLVGTWAVRAQDLAPIPRLAYLTAERAELPRMRRTCKFWCARLPALWS